MWLNCFGNELVLYFLHVIDMYPLTDLEYSCCRFGHMNLSYFLHTNLGSLGLIWKIMQKLYFITRAHLFFIFWKMEQDTWYRITLKIHRTLFTYPHISFFFFQLPPTVVTKFFYDIRDKQMSSLTISIMSHLSSELWVLVR